MHASRIRITIGNSSTGFTRTSDLPVQHRDKFALGAEIKSALGLVDRPARRRFNVNARRNAVGKLPA